MESAQNGTHGYRTVRDHEASRSLLTQRTVGNRREPGFCRIFWAQPTGILAKPPDMFVSFHKYSLLFISFDVSSANYPSQDIPRRSPSCLPKTKLCERCSWMQAMTSAAPKNITKSHSIATFLFVQSNHDLKNLTKLAKMKDSVSRELHGIPMHRLYSRN